MAKTLVADVIIAVLIPVVIGTLFAMFDQNLMTGTLLSALIGGLFIILRVYQLKDATTT
ncbi:MAG: hypothetical protein Kow00117_09320 [Phototrophicales bacterium]